MQIEPTGQVDHEVHRLSQQRVMTHQSGGTCAAERA